MDRDHPNQALQTLLNCTDNMIPSSAIQGAIGNSNFLSQFQGENMTVLVIPCGSEDQNQATEFPYEM
jgi:hypothetical protein